MPLASILPETASLFSNIAVFTFCIAIETWVIEYENVKHRVSWNIFVKDSCTFTAAFIISSFYVMAEKLRPFFYTLRFLYFLTLLKKYFESYVCMACLKKFSILAKNRKEIIEFKIIRVWYFLHLLNHIVFVILVKKMSD